MKIELPEELAEELDTDEVQEILSDYLCDAMYQEIGDKIEEYKTSMLCPGCRFRVLKAILEAVETILESDDNGQHDARDLKLVKDGNGEGKKE